MSIKERLSELKKSVDKAVKAVVPGKLTHVGSSPVFNNQEQQARLSSIKDLNINFSDNILQGYAILDDYQAMIDAIETPDTDTDLEKPFKKIKKVAQLNKSEQKQLNDIYIKTKALAALYTEGQGSPQATAEMLDELADEVNQILQKKLAHVKKELASPEMTKESFDEEELKSINQYKTTIISTIDQYNKKVKADFDAHKESYQSLRSSNRALEIALLKHLADMNSHNRRAIKQLQQTLPAVKDGRMVVGSEQAKDNDSIISVSLNQLQSIKTEHGSKIQNQGEGVWSMSIQNGFFYKRLGLHDNKTEDFFQLASVIKAQGYNKITFTINYDVSSQKYNHVNSPDHKGDPKKLRELNRLARQQFKAAVYAGFNPNSVKGKPGDITMVLNGKETSIETIYQNCPAELQELCMLYNRKYANLDTAFQNDLDRKIEKNKDSDYLDSGSSPSMGG